MELAALLYRALKPAVSGRGHDVVDIEGFSIDIRGVLNLVPAEVENDQNVPAKVEKEDAVLIPVNHLECEPGIAIRRDFMPQIMIFPDEARIC